MPTKEAQATSTKATSTTDAIKDDNNPVVEDAVAKEVGSENSVLSSLLMYLFIGSALLVIPISIFVQCGGYQWIYHKLRDSKGEYKRVRGQDLEK